jgi:hypothetical protein
MTEVACNKRVVIREEVGTHRNQDIRMETPVMGKVVVDANEKCR